METIELNLATADRQAFGKSYARTENTEEMAAAVLSGELHLPPHPVWRGDPVDWAADPFTDRNWQFQHHTLRWTNPLRWKALDGDAHARQEWLRIVRSWAENNVPAHQSPSKFAWKDMADGNRAIQLGLGARLVGQDDLPWFLELLTYHRDWLMDEAHIVGKNHGLHQHAGLLVVSAVLGDLDGMNVARGRMVEQFKSTFDAQGGNDEGSTSYHQLNLRWWVQSWQRVSLEGLEVPKDVKQRLSAAGTVLAHMAQPDGRLPQIGDSARGNVGVGLDPVSDFAATRGRSGMKPTETVRVLDNGYVFSRSGWGETRPVEQESHLLIRHGVDVRAHSHEDRGSVHIYANGRPWLVDSGFHSYQKNDPTRTYLHSREAHNVATVVGAKHDDSVPVELTRQIVEEEYHDFELVDRGYRNTVLRRRVVYLTGPDCWIVRDQVESDEPVAMRQHWHADVDVSASRHDRGFELRDGKRSLNMIWLGGLPRLARHRAVDGDPRAWIGTRWKTQKPGTLITADAPARASTLVTMIAPSAPQELGVVRSYLTTTGVLDAVLMRGPRVWRVRLEEDSVIAAEQKRNW
ncbi:heparinase II/III domain-containing protein [Kocuria carniphila]|uniref:heparinase II/III domain-containing protein n=1 Tax=Kocuria carniphila TaxID=262208 RepID=UPI0034CF75CB